MLWSATRHKFLNDTQTNIVCWWFASALDKYNASQVKWTKPIYYMNTLNTTVTVSHCARSRQIVPSKWQPLVFMRCLCSQVMMRPRRRKSCSSSKSTQPGDDETLVGWCVCVAACLLLVTSIVMAHCHSPPTNEKSDRCTLQDDFLRIQHQPSMTWWFP